MDKCKKSIIFILPAPKNKPVGGYKIVYEYANRLTERGWNVSVGYYCCNAAKKYRIPDKIRKTLVKVVSEYRRIKYPNWFKLSSKIKTFCIYSPSMQLKTSNIVATAYCTAEYVYHQDNCNKIYLIQDFENWGTVTADNVKKTYLYGMKNVVIAKWLKTIVDDVCRDEKSILISNGIDFSDFQVKRCIENRLEKKICMLYHLAPYKGSKYGIEALIRLKEIYPELQATLFGVPDRPDDLPKWIEYIQNADSNTLCDIYNSSQIYLYPTIEEGFGLTCVEAMACGCALCATDYRGVHEFAIDGENALLSPIKDVDKMVNNACRLLEDEQLRINIARRGSKHISMFAWEESVDKFEFLLCTD